jgi:hypothetical protein
MFKRFALLAIFAGLATTFVGCTSKTDTGASIAISR